MLCIQFFRLFSIEGNENFKTNDSILMIVELFIQMRLKLVLNIYSLNTFSIEI